jgi:signal transduction histidine kinase
MGSRRCAAGYTTTVVRAYCSQPACSAPDLVGKEPEHDETAGYAKHPGDEVLHAAGPSKLKAAETPGLPLPQPHESWLADRLHDARHALAEAWLTKLQAELLAGTAEVVPLRALGVHVPHQIAGLADYLRRPPGDDINNNPRVMEDAAKLGALRFVQHATVHQLLREYQILSDLVGEFLIDQVAHAEPSMRGELVARVMWRVTQSVRALQQQTVDTFVARYTAAIERQNLQLLSFGRVVGHEMRQPLGVLQVIGGVIPVREGDIELTHLLNVFQRNVRRLADVAARLERLSHTGVDETVFPTNQRTDLGALLADVVEKLGDLAQLYDVHIQVGADLPTLVVDPARTEMVFTNLISNAIKYSDPAKTKRLVEVLNLPGERSATVIVRDNGIGIPAKRVQHIFREFVRAHAERDRELRAEGLGLGLSIVREAMDASGGTVRLESVEQEGTTVTLTWPERTRPR